MNSPKDMDLEGSEEFDELIKEQALSIAEALLENSEAAIERWESWPQGKRALMFSYSTVFEEMINAYYQARARMDALSPTDFHLWVLGLGYGEFDYQRRIVSASAAMVDRYMQGAGSFRELATWIINRISAGSDRIDELTGDEDDPMVHHDLGLLEAVQEYRDYVDEDNPRFRSAQALYSAQIEYSVALENYRVCLLAWEEDPNQPFGEMLAKLRRARDELVLAARIL
ncbi:hypothetical protein [Streptomyces sp. NPDC090112]|uniref:hypothetical protein n=1 Tax=Streptomyces sp. NPDC090112 TaxID=3365949 RepID=UPI003808AA19